MHRTHATVSTLQLDRSDTAIDRICRSLNRLATYYSIAENQTVLSLRHAFASAMESASGEVHEREVAAMKYGDDITVDDTHIVDIRRELHARGPVLVGVHNGAAVVPLEIEAGIFENATPALASSVTRGLRSVRFATTRPRCRLPIDVSHRDRRSNALESERGPIHQALPRIEPIVRAFKGIPPRVDLVRLERMTVPMVNPVDSEPPS